MPSSAHLVHDRAKLQRLHDLHEPIGTVGEVLEKASSFIEENAETGAQAISTAGKAAGWLSWIEPSAATFSIVALAAKALGKWIEIKDPYEQGALACTLAWQAAANRALVESGISNIFTYRATRGLGDRIAKRLRALPKPEEVSLATFSWSGTTVHPFVQRADEMLRTFLRSVHEDGKSAAITTEQEIRIFDALHEGFRHELERVLFANETKERFAFFAELLKTDRAEAERARQALHIHADYQQRLFTSLPLFGQEEFALGDVYINTQCGELTWGNISRIYAHGPAGKRDADAGEVFGLNQFLEKNGGRKDLLKTVMRLLTEAPPNEPIVIQGFAGQGKSSFTLRLCAELMKPEHGFTPLRIRLKNLPLDGDLFEGLVRALELDDPDPQTQQRYNHLGGFKLDKALFDEPHGLHHKMSRYVVILDGWDELQIGGDAGFRKRVEDVMRRVRETFLQSGWACPPRIIVTGRPNPDVEASALLQKNTPFLTIRDLRAGQLRVFVRQLAHAQAAARLTPSAKDGAAYQPWCVPRPAVFNPVFMRYKKALDQVRRNGGRMQDEFEVLGSPLLTYLLMRLMSEAAAHCRDEAEQQSAIETLIKQPTRLYRSLTDLTVEKAGKAPFGDANDDDHQRMVRERDAETLRRKLRLTAAAMSVVGQESLTRKEWEARLPKEFTANEDADDPFVKLMISFYFKGGHTEQGIEFAHKSFREYLFAEHIVETIKETVSQPNFALPLPHPLTDGPHRWQDFEQRDVRFEFSRELSCLLAPQWLSREVRAHLAALLELEIERSASAPLLEKHVTLLQEFGRPTPKLTWTQWQHTRDLLADLWAWWLHAIHLRPQLHFNRQGRPEKLLPPYVWELLEVEMRHKSNPLDESQPQPSITAADAHLGDGLILLTAHLHWLIAQAEGWQGQWPALTEENVKVEEVNTKANFLKPDANETSVQTQPGPRLCQTSVRQGEQTWIVFEPNGEPRTDNELNRRWHQPIGKSRTMMRLVTMRIRAEAGRPNGYFPNAIFIKGVDLRHTVFWETSLDNASLDNANLDAAFLRGASLDGASLNDASLNGAFFGGASLNSASLNSASLNGAFLGGAFLGGAFLDGANLNGANLSHASLNGASLNSASLNGASLSNASFRKSHVFRKVALYPVASSLAEVIGLTEEQLLSVDWLAEETILPEQFNDVKERILQRQRDWQATMPAEENLESEPAEDEAETAAQTD